MSLTYINLMIYKCGAISSSFLFVKVDIYITNIQIPFSSENKIRCHQWDLHLLLNQINQQVIHFPVPCQIKAHGTIVPCGVQHLVVAPGFNCFICGTGDAVILRVIRLKLGTCTIQYKFIFFSWKDFLWITIEVNIESHNIQYTGNLHHVLVTKYLCEICSILWFCCSINNGYY